MSTMQFFYFLQHCYYSNYKFNTLLLLQFENYSNELWHDMDIVSEILP